MIKVNLGALVKCIIPTIARAVQTSPGWENLLFRCLCGQRTTPQEEKIQLEHSRKSHSINLKWTTSLESRDTTTHPHPEFRKRKGPFFGVESFPSCVVDSQHVSAHTIGREIVCFDFNCCFIIVQHRMGGSLMDLFN